MSSEESVEHAVSARQQFTHVQRAAASALGVWSVCTRLARDVVFAAVGVLVPPPPKLTIPPSRMRDWIVNFEVRGRAGETKDIEVYPQCLYRGEKLIATDNAESPGEGTRIGTIRVGQKHQKTESRTPTKVFAGIALGNGASWEACDPSLPIVIKVHFEKDCTFNATSFGKAVM